MNNIFWQKKITDDKLNSISQKKNYPINTNNEKIIKK